METHSKDSPLAISDAQQKADCVARALIEQIAEKWTIFVIDALSTHGKLRFSQIRDEIHGISPKMLTKTLRQLERAGLLSRHVHAVIPPQVDYTLTPLGCSLRDKICGIREWVESHMEEFENARRQLS